MAFIALVIHPPLWALLFFISPESFRGCRVPAVPGSRAPLGIPDSDQGVLGRGDRVGFLEPSAPPTRSTWERVLISISIHAAGYIKLSLSCSL